MNKPANKKVDQDQELRCSSEGEVYKEYYLKVRVKQDLTPLPEGTGRLLVMITFTDTGVNFVKGDLKTVEFKDGKPVDDFYNRYLIRGYFAIYNQ